MKRGRKKVRNTKNKLESNEMSKSNNYTCFLYNHHHTNISPKYFKITPIKKSIIPKTAKKLVQQKRRARIL